MFQKNRLTIFFCAFILSVFSLHSQSKQPLGLVLCGNSVRALSHIGVIRSLENSDIKPDFIVADSIGALIGTLYISGFSPDDIDKIFTSADFNSIFKTVQPDKSGNFNSLFFDSFISELFNDKTFEINDAPIPIFIPMKDLHSGRDYLISEGDIRDVMHSIFSMCYMLEPVNINQIDGQVTRLSDSNRLDFLTLEIAERYSRNLIISAPQYKPEIRFDDSATLIGNFVPQSNQKSVLNQMFSTSYSWIHTDLEDFSFSDYNSIENIINSGEAACDKYISTHFMNNIGSFSYFLYETPGFDYLRRLRKNTTDKVCKDIGKRLNLYIKNQRANPLQLENIPAVELKDFFYSEQLSSGLYTFFDFRPLFIRTGIKTNFFTFWGPDKSLLPKIKTTLFSDFSPMNLSGSAFSEITEQDIVLGLENKKTFYIPGVFNIKPYITGELAMHFTKEGLEEKKFLIRSGTELFNTNHPLLKFTLNPYVYIFSNEFWFTPNQQIGAGGIFAAELTAFPNFGYKLANSFRYQKNGAGIILNKNDGYRGKCPADKPEVNGSTYINLLQMEYFWFITNVQASAIEKIKMPKIKAGIYYDFLMFKNELLHSAGIFIRPQLIILDKSVANLELYTGFDTSEQITVFGVNFTQHW